MDYVIITTYPCEKSNFGLFYVIIVDVFKFYVVISGVNRGGVTIKFAKSQMGYTMFFEKVNSWKRRKNGLVRG